MASIAAQRAALKKAGVNKNTNRPTCKLAGIEFPMPIALAEVGVQGEPVTYWQIYMSTGDATWTHTNRLNDREVARRRVKGGLCHWTPDAAQQHIMALTAFSQSVIDGAIERLGSEL